ncbi:MAG: HAMP domain-containing histidine kinase [Actinobacteria bacterium]|nr:HAMP domain-containing histidine kinase [Actinomycetota bacterium]
MTRSWARIGRVLSPSRWSLRLRLVVGVAVLAAVGLAVSGTLGVTLLRSYLVHQVDQQLAGIADRAPGGFGGPERRILDPGAVSARSQALPTPFVFTVLGPSGQIVSQAGGSSAADKSPRPQLAGLTPMKLAAESGRPFTLPSTDGGSDFRVRTVTNADGTTTVIALSLESSDATVRRMELTVMIVAVVVLVLLIGSAALMVRLGLRPLRGVEVTAEGIAGGDLSRRVPVAGPGSEVGRLAASLNWMLDEVETAFAARARSEETLRQFIADASHELRTPLTTVRGYAELVNRGALTDAGEHRHAMGRIESEAARMGSLVEDLLLLAYLDQQRPLNAVRADAVALVEDAVTDARARDRARRIDYVGPDRPVPVVVDVDRMRQVLDNLLSNALVHTPPAARIEVMVATDEAHVRITVADDGPGLDEDQRRRLFERFYRADPARSRARGGTGLGLSIVAAVVDASGGTVGCTSEPGRGAAFTVTLPLAPAVVGPPLLAPVI